MEDRVDVAKLVEVDSVPERDGTEQEEGGTLGVSPSLLPTSSPPLPPAAMLPLPTLLGPPAPSIPVACRISARALLLLTVLPSGLRSTTMTLPWDVGVLLLGVTLEAVTVPRGPDGFCKTVVLPLLLMPFPIVIFVGTS